MDGSVILQTLKKLSCTASKSPGRHAKVPYERLPLDKRICNAKAAKQFILNLLCSVCICPK